MKKSVTCLLIIILCAASAKFGCFAQEHFSETDYEKKEVNALLYGKEQETSLEILLFDDFPFVPYISAADYLSRIFTVPFDCEKLSETLFLVFSGEKKMLVDTRADTIHFDELENFMFRDIRADESAQTPFVKPSQDYEFVGEVFGADLCPGEYGIDLIAVSDQVYFPLTTISDLFADTNNAAVYLDETLYFFHSTKDGFIDRSSAFQSLYRDPEFADYSYRELCFVMDNLYGKPPKARLSDSISEIGFDRTLREYSEDTRTIQSLLLSENTVDYYYGLLSLQCLNEDGGHSVFLIMRQINNPNYRDCPAVKAFLSSAEEGTDPGYILWNRLYRENARYAYEQRSQMEKTREEAFGKMKTVREWTVGKGGQAQIFARFLQHKDLAVFSFDSFNGRVIRPFKWSLDYAEKNGVRNFLIDLSCNGGGDDSVLIYISSLVMGTDTIRTIHTLTKNRYINHYAVDQDLDGNFEDDFEEPYPFRFAFLASGASFSCANLLAVMAKDEGIMVLGEKSAGGTCYMTYHNDADMRRYSISDPVMLVNENWENLDAGAEPDRNLTGIMQDGTADYTGFYDPVLISELMNDYYD